jgi:hypothetical protein
MTTVAETVIVPSARRPVKRRALSFLTIYLAANVMAAAAHLALGASPLVVLLALGSVIVSVIPAAIYGWRDMPALLCLLGGARFAASALFWKLFEWSPLDEGLYAPVTSFIVVILGTVAVALAAVVAHVIWRARPWFVEQINARGFACLLILSLFLVSVTFALTLSDTKILGGVQKLVVDGLVLLPLAYIGFNIHTSRPRISYGLFLLVFVYFFASFVFNSRAGTAVMLMSLFATLLSYGYKPRLKTVMVIAPLIVFYVAIVSPAMLDARYYRGIVDNSELIGITLDNMRARMTGRSVPKYYDPGEVAEEYLMHYLKGGGEAAGRIVIVQELDFIVALAESRGLIGTERFWSSLIELLPSALISDKAIISAPDYPFWIYGVLEPGSQTNLEQTIYGSAYTYGGFSFVFTGVFSGFLALFLFFRIFCPTFSNSAFAPFIVVSYAHPLTAGSMIELYSALARSLPFELLLFWLVSLISRHAVGNIRYPTKAVF